jgi:hypothetical protein
MIHVSTQLGGLGDAARFPVGVLKNGLLFDEYFIAVDHDVGNDTVFVEVEHRKLGVHEFRRTTGIGTANIRIGSVGK